jgi:hypothetical protein
MAVPKSLQLLLDDVRHFADQGMKMPIRTNIKSNVSNFIDRLRPDAMQKVKRIAGERIEQIAYHDKRSLVSTGVGVGAGLAGHQIAVAAGAAAAATTLGVAAGVATLGAVPAAIGLGILVNVAVSASRSSDKKAIRDKFKPGQAAGPSEKELFYLLSHGELVDLARSFQKAVEAETAYYTAQLKWNLESAKSKDCLMLLDLTWRLMRWRKRLRTSLLESPRLLSKKRHQQERHREGLSTALDPRKGSSQDDPRWIQNHPKEQGPDRSEYHTA